MGRRVGRVEGDSSPGPEAWTLDRGRLMAGVCLSRHGSGEGLFGEIGDGSILSIA